MMKASLFWVCATSGDAASGPCELEPALVQASTASVEIARPSDRGPRANIRRMRNLLLHMAIKLTPFLRGTTGYPGKKSQSPTPQRKCRGCVWPIKAAVGVPGIMGTGRVSTHDAAADFGQLRNETGRPICGDTLCGTAQYCCDSLCHHCMPSPDTCSSLVCGTADGDTFDSYPWRPERHRWNSCRKSWRSTA